jgi:hypothetical protein
MIIRGRKGLDGIYGKDGADCGSMCLIAITKIIK